EDGIRDRNVTGVQTCALPIFRGFGSDVAEDLDQVLLVHAPRGGGQRPGAEVADPGALPLQPLQGGGDGGVLDMADHLDVEHVGAQQLAGGPGADSGEVHPAQGELLQRVDPAAGAVATGRETRAKRVKASATAATSVAITSSP